MVCVLAASLTHDVQPRSSVIDAVHWPPMPNMHALASARAISSDSANPTQSAPASIPPLPFEDEDVEGDVEDVEDVEDVDDVELCEDPAGPTSQS
jgi:hypothetical protein